jgi:hypothetical protein
MRKIAYILILQRVVLYIFKIKSTGGSKKIETKKYYFLLSYKDEGYYPSLP